MTAICNITSRNYTYFEYRKAKDGFFHEIKARNIFSRKFYGLRFNKNKFSCFFFFIFEPYRKKHITYALRNTDEYGSGSDWSVILMIRLEQDIISNKVTPLFRIENRRIVYSSIDRSEITYIPEYPEMPFYFQEELKSLSFDENAKRYKYSYPPRYIIISKSVIKGRDTEKTIYMLYGCNKENVYNAVTKNSLIEVTRKDCKVRALACGKCENIYNIIPKQHCIAVCNGV